MVTERVPPRDVAVFQPDTFSFFFFIFSFTSLVSIFLLPNIAVKFTSFLFFLVCFEQRNWVRICCCCNRCCRARPQRIRRKACLSFDPQSARVDSPLATMARCVFVLGALYDRYPGERVASFLSASALVFLLTLTPAILKGHTW